MPGHVSCSTPERAELLLKPLFSFLWLQQCLAYTVLCWHYSIKMKVRHREADKRAILLAAAAKWYRPTSIAQQNLECVVLRRHPYVLYQGEHGSWVQPPGPLMLVLGLHSSGMYTKGKWGFWLTWTILTFSHKVMATIPEMRHNWVVVYFSSRSAGNTPLSTLFPSVSTYRLLFHLLNLNLHSRSRL